MNTGEKIRAFILMAVLLIILVFGMITDPISKKDNSAMTDNKKFVLNAYTPHRSF